MRTVFLASLRTHTRRYVAAAIAVIVSVAFVVVIGVLTAGARSGLMDSFGAPFRNADHVIDGDPAEKDPTRLPRLIWSRALGRTPPGSAASSCRCTPVTGVAKPQ